MVDKGNYLIKERIISKDIYVTVLTRSRVKDVVDLIIGIGLLDLILMRIDGIVIHGDLLVIGAMNDKGRNSRLVDGIHRIGIYIILIKKD